MNLSRRPGRDWKLYPFQDCPAIYTSRPPCWFHRLMQRLILGFRWVKQ